VNQESNQTSVLVVDPTNKVQERPVTLGIQTENEAEVLSGLGEGDQVVISDKSGLKAGELVHSKITHAANYKAQS
jgi:multidrug efflux pump subunit AcrA (membrane-fusion protein)